MNLNKICLVSSRRDKKLLRYRYYERIIIPSMICMPGISDATSLAQMIQQLQDSPDLNRQVWLRGSMKAIINRQDMTDFKIPSLFDVSPCTVFPTEIIQDVQVQARRPQPERVTGRNEISDT